MKNSKREITLNEKDSLLDMAYAEKALAEDYRLASFNVERKEVRAFLSEELDAVIADAQFLSDLARDRK